MGSEANQKYNENLIFVSSFLDFLESLDNKETVPISGISIATIAREASIKLLEAIELNEWRNSENK